MQILDVHLIEIEKRAEAFFKEYRRSLDLFFLEFESILKSLKSLQKVNYNEINKFEDKLNEIKLLYQEIFDDLSGQRHSFYLNLELYKKEKISENMKDVSKCTDVILDNINSTISKLQKLNLEIITYIIKVTSDKDIIDRTNKIFNNTKYRLMNLKSVYLKINSLILGDSILLSKNKNDLFEYFKETQVTGKRKINKKEIYLQVNGKFSLLDKIGDKLIFDYLLEKCSSILNRIGLPDNIKIRTQTLKNRLTGNKKDMKEIENMICGLIFNSIVNILTKHPELIRASKVEIFVNIVSVNVNKGYLGIYLSSRSDFSKVFIELSLTEGFLYALCIGQLQIAENQLEYETIIHEFLHAYDYKLNTEQRITNAASSLVNNDSRPEITSLVELMNILRQEGIAGLFGVLNRRLDDPLDSIVLSLDEIIENLEQAKSSIKDIFNKAPVQSPELINRIIINLTKSGMIHTYGAYMMLVILFDKFRDNINFWNCKKDNMHDVLLEFKSKDYNFWEIADTYGWIFIRPKSLSRFMQNNSGLNFQIYKKDFDKIKQLLTAVSMMDYIKFLDYYLSSCQDLKLDPSPIDRNTFIEVNERSHETFKKLVHAFGF